jgi:hypothetical protein
MYNWSTFGAWTNRGQTQTHKTHHGLDLREATTFPFIIFYVPGHRASTHNSFCLATPNLGVSKFPKLGLLRLWRPITSSTDLRLRWGFKQSCIHHREFSKDMQHATFTRVNKRDSWLLVIKSWISTLTPDPSFGHNYVLSAQMGHASPFLTSKFQWYNEHFNQINFDPCNRPLNIWESIWTLIPKVGTHLGVWGSIPSHFPTLLGAWNVTPRLIFGPHLCKPVPSLRAQG